MVDCFILPMDVCDMVLSTQWLCTLGPIWWDFARLLMRFMWKGKDVELRGIKPPVHHMDEDKEMEREVKRKKCGLICHIKPLNNGVIMEGNLNSIVLGAKQKGSSCTEQQLLPILKFFSNLVDEPQCLPPTRSHDHQIPLKPESGPINMRPYTYPHYHKNEIEKLYWGSQAKHEPLFISSIISQKT